MFFTAFGDNDNKTKLERLYYKHRNQMYWVAYRILSDKELAEDAVSESFYRIIKHLDKIDEKDSTKASGFLITVCRNVAIDIKKKHSKEILEGDMNNLSGDEDNAENIVVKSENSREIADAIKSLNAIYRDIIILKYAHDLTNGDIAKLLGISRYVVEKRLSRAKTKLSEQLEGRIYDEKR